MHKNYRIPEKHFYTDKTWTIILKALFKTGENYIANGMKIEEVYFYEQDRIKVNIYTLWYLHFKTLTRV